MSNPYQNLKTAAQEFCRKVENRKRRLIRVWHKDAVNLDTYSIKLIFDIGTSLGYDVEVVNKDGSIHFYYVDKIPSIPWELR